MLDALTHTGYPLPAGCREGVCGSCEITVTEGDIDHRDDIGAPAGRMYPCVSRARSACIVWTCERGAGAGGLRAGLGSSSRPDAGEGDRGQVFARGRNPSFRPGSRAATWRVSGCGALARRRLAPVKSG
ncbi:2Fe-2S iron-sulfur cluster binding domain-containing protein [Streptomyces sp. NPDC048518]|uniref:2Fe-2S iron-sulfur cluster-binding protein n=1 Tax=Streptomyces sp. NPDC048518 TaxID=3155029 RepID=UPI003410CCFD